MASTPERKRKITTEIPSEVTNWTWKVKNFQNLVEMKNPLEDIKLPFEAGDSINLPCKWHFCFDTSTVDNDKLGIFLKLDKSPKDQKDVYSKFEVKLKRPDGNNWFSTGSPPENMKALPEGEDYYGFEDGVGSLKALMWQKSKILIDGALVLHIRFEMFAYDQTKPETVVNMEARDAKFRRMQMQSHIQESRLAVSNDLEKLLDSGEGADVTIQMKDGKKFMVHGAILATRSPVYFAEFQSKIGKTGKFNGVVKINDVSSAAMGIIIKFIYTGAVDDNWMDYGEEILNACKKYSLTILQEFCNKTMIDVCTPQNAMDLLMLSRKFDLDTAVKDISEFAKNNFNGILKRAK